MQNLVTRDSKGLAEQSVLLQAPHVILMLLENHRHRQSPCGVANSGNGQVALQQFVFWIRDYVTMMITF